MPIYIRRIIFGLFVFIFIISAAAILFYGSGYRWNSAKNKIEKTGQLSLDSRPRGAEVFINGEPAQGTWKRLIGSPIQTTPAVIKNVLPGEYSVEIKKDGYYPWKKTVNVLSGQTALFQGIRLLRQEESEKIFDGNIIQFARISDTIFAILTHRDLFLYDARQKQLRQVFHSEKNPLLSFSARLDGMQFFVRAENAQWVAFADGTLRELPYDKVHMLSRVRWTSGGELFGQVRDAIVAVSAVPASSVSAFKKIISGAPDDFFIQGNRLFTIDGKGKKTVQMRELSRPQAKPVEVLSLPGGGGIFLDEPSYDIAIQKAGGGMIILSPSRIGKAFEILELESIEQLSEKKDAEFLGWNDVELWNYKISGREYGKTLLTRQSTPLQKAFFSSIVPAVFFLSDNSVTMIDRAEPAENQTKLFQWENISDMTLSKDEKEFFISGTLNGVSGFYRLRIMD